MRAHHKALNAQKRFENQQKTVEQSAGAQIDARCYLNLAGIEAKVKSIIKETVKSQSIKKRGSWKGHFSFDVRYEFCC